MLVAAIGEHDHEPRARPRRPDHEHRGDREPNGTALRQEQRHGGEDHHRQHAVANHARARVQVEVTIPPGEHVVHDVEEDGGDDNPAENDAELDLPGEELEEAERHIEENRAGEVRRILVDGRIDPERVEDGLGFAPDLIWVDPELVQQRLLVLEARSSGGASHSTDDRAAVDRCGGGGGRCGPHVE